MSDIKFSIIVPAFKKQFLKECIDSILAQSYDNFEVIIIMIIRLKIWMS